MQQRVDTIKEFLFQLRDLRRTFEELESEFPERKEDEGLQEIFQRMDKSIEIFQRWIYTEEEKLQYWLEEEEARPSKRSFSKRTGH